MKNAFMIVMLVLGVVLPGSAGPREEALIGSLLGLGVRAMQAHETTVPGNEAAEVAPASPSAAPVASSMMAASFGQMLTSSLKPSLDGLIEQYKEQYKEEGRAYAREMGNIVVSRVVQDPEINATISSLRTLCWSVVAYLTLVTILMLGCLIYLKQANARLLAEVRRMARQNSN